MDIPTSVLGGKRTSVGKRHSVLNMSPYGKRMTVHRPNFKRRHYRGRKRNDDVRLPLFAGGCFVVAVLAMLNTDKLPPTAQALVSAVHNLGRANQPPAGAYYYNCTEARAAEVAPIYVGEPGYRAELDADSDGIACEPYRGT
jgi:hypothetical protein